MPKRRHATSLRHSPCHPSHSPVFVVVVILMAIVVETGGICRRTSVLSKKIVSSIKMNEKEKENIQNAQETLCDVSWVFSLWKRCTYALI